MGLLSYRTVPYNRNVVYDGTAHMYAVQERPRRSQASDVAMQLLQEGMAHLYVPIDHFDYLG